MHDASIWRRGRHARRPGIRGETIVREFGRRWEHWCDVNVLGLREPARVELGRVVAAVDGGERGGDGDVGVRDGEKVHGIFRHFSERDVSVDQYAHAVLLRQEFARGWGKSSERVADGQVGLERARVATRDGVATRKCLAR